MAEIDGVLSLPLERTDAPKYKLVASFKDGRTIRGTTSAYGRWTHLLARREVRKGAQRLYVIRRSESEKAIRQKIREESKQIPKDRLVVFTVGARSTLTEVKQQ